MPSDLAVVILAAGRSTRFNSAKTKVLHCLAGRPLLEWSLRAVRGLDPGQCIIVHGSHNGAELADHFDASYMGMSLQYALQDPPLGTGHALLQVESLLDSQVTHLLVLPGDAPLLRLQDLLSLEATRQAKRVEHAVLTAVLSDPRGYGRILRDPQQPDIIQRIVEHNDADARELEICEVNSGMYIFSRNVFDHLLQAAQQLGASASKGEYYLPDVVRFGLTTAVQVEDPARIEGVNDRVQLAAMEAVVQSDLRVRWMRSGVSFLLPETCYLEDTITLGQDVTVGPGCMLLGETHVGQGSVLEAGCILRDCIVGADCHLLHVRGHGAVLRDGVTAGPYVNLRPGTELAEGVKIGNFVETKQAKVGRNSKLPHLTYAGDAEIGERVNIGAGTIFCNYDGVSKQVTRIGDNVFVGSNSSLQAPLEIGSGAYIGMASAITRDVPPDTLAIGRARQENKPGYAARLRQQQARRKETSSVEPEEASDAGGAA